jgi:thiol-disulfide isomerase/thioredoxin
MNSLSTHISVTQTSGLPYRRTPFCEPCDYPLTCPPPRNATHAAVAQFVNVSALPAIRPTIGNFLCARRHLISAYSAWSAGLLVFLLIAPIALRAELPPGWKTDYTNSLGESKSQQRPLLIYFTASWCGPCRTMARTTFTNQLVVQALRSFIPLALDIDDHSDLAEHYGIHAVPTFQIFTPAGQQAAATTGYLDADPFIAWLTNGAAAVKATLERQRLIEQKLAAAQGLLRDAVPESQRQAASELFDLCAEQNGLADETVKSCLNDLARNNPALLLAGLNHPRLVVRIGVANLLRARLGDSFDIDPWSDAGSRQQAVAQWRDGLASAPP